MIFDLAAKVHFFLGLTKAKRLHEGKTIVFKANHSQRGSTPSDNPRESQDYFATARLIQARKTKTIPQSILELFSSNYPLSAAESSSYFYIIRNLLYSKLGVKVRNVGLFLQKRQRKIQKRRRFLKKRRSFLDFSRTFSHELRRKQE